MALRQLLFEVRLTWEQPVHGFVEFGLVGRIQLQHLAETVVQSVGMQSASGGQLGAAGGGGPRSWQ
jgi:hypothetical protein